MPGELAGTHRAKAQTFPELLPGGRDARLALGRFTEDTFRAAPLRCRAEELF